MTNAIAFVIMVVIAGLFAADHLWLHWHMSVMVARAGDAFIDYLSFWR